jgi:hypothetical protein
MKIEEFNPGYSFRVGGVSYGRLCRYLSTLPGLAFTRRRRFFWSIQDVRAEFTFHEHIFFVDTDPWDYALWVLTADKQIHPPEMQALREHIERERRSRWGLFSFLGSTRNERNNRQQTR